MAPSNETTSTVAPPSSRAKVSAAELEFPGISRFYAETSDKPSTFLELVWRYQVALRDAGPQAERFALAA